MHVCNIISVPYPPCEGIGHYIHGFCDKLIKNGHEVTIITRGNCSKTQHEIVNGINVIRAPFIPIYPFYIHLHGAFVNKIFKSMESKIDLVHIHTPLSPVIKTKLPVVTTIHSSMLSDNKNVKIRSVYAFLSKLSARLVSYPLEQKLISSSDMITTVSKSVANELQNYNLDSDKIKILHNGVDKDFFYPAEKKHDEKKQILYVGRMDREKGLFDLVESAKQICKKHSDVYFTLVGSGRDLNKLKNMVKKLGLEDRFIFTGQLDRNRLVEIYQDTDLFVFPSYHEGLPTAILEAMSCGLAIVATDVRGNKDLVNDGINGVLIPPRSPVKIAGAITVLLEDEELQKKLGKNARKTIVEKYTWDMVSDRIIECYENLNNKKTQKNRLNV